jgi:hypothetical protein
LDDELNNHQAAYVGLLKGGNLDARHKSKRYVHKASAPKKNPVKRGVKKIKPHIKHKREVSSDMVDAS